MLRNVISRLNWKGNILHSSHAASYQEITDLARVKLVRLKTLTPLRHKEKPESQNVKSNVKS
jgi:hypothetical protein